MSDFFVEDLPILEGRIVHPARGAWSADLDVAADVSLTGRVTVRLPGLDLVGTVTDAGIIGGLQRVQVIGGRGGVLKAQKGQHYRQAIVRTVAENILAEAGEQLAADSDANALGHQLAHYQSPPGGTGAALDALCALVGTSWTVTPAGEIRIGLPTYLPTEMEHVLVDDHQDERAMVIAPQDQTPQPGITFLGQKIESVEHQIEAGLWRCTLRYTAPLEELLRGLVQHLAPTTAQTVFEGEVVAQNADGTVDVRLDEALQLGPGYQGVPVALIGPFTVKVAPGAMALIEFVNGDLRRPLVRQYQSATFTEVTLNATSKITLGAPAVDVGNTGAAVKLAGGSKPVVRSGDNVTGPANGGGVVTGVIAFVPPPQPTTVLA